MKKTVLFAEDDEYDALALGRAFRRLCLPYELKNIKDGQEVIDYLQGTGEFADRARFPFPSMLILDWNLPSRSGEEILAWIKSQADLPRLFVIILTGSTLARTPRETVQQFGRVQVFNCHFLKPIADHNLQMIMQIFEVWQKNES